MNERIKRAASFLGFELDVAGNVIVGEQARLWFSHDKYDVGTDDDAVLILRVLAERREMMSALTVLVDMLSNVSWEHDRLPFFLKKFISRGEVEHIRVSANRLCITYSTHLSRESWSVDAPTWAARRTVMAARAGRVVCKIDDEAGDGVIDVIPADEWTRIVRDGAVRGTDVITWSKLFEVFSKISAVPCAMAHVRLDACNTIARREVLSENASGLCSPCQEFMRNDSTRTE